MLKNNLIIDGPLTARLFKYYSQQNKSLAFTLPLNKVPYKCLYTKYKKQFDNLSRIFNYEKMDIDKYIKWCVLDCKFQFYDISTKLLNQYTIDKYFKYLKIQKEHKKIFNYFMNSVETIAKDCIKLNYNYTVDYFHYLIKTRKIAQYYFTGKISKYYFVMIPKFKEIIQKLDNLSKEQFYDIYNMFEKYYNDIIESMEQEINKIVLPFSYTNEKIQQLKKQNQV